MLVALALLFSPQGAYTPYVAPASNDGETAIESMKVPDGFQVKLWAAEPHLANPVAMYVTNKGEVFVAETFRIKSGVDDIRDHMDWLDDDLACRSVEDRVAYLRRHVGEKFDELYTKDHERLRWVADTDGDGKADTDSVFADNFASTADGIAAGVLESRGKVYFTCMPNLWELSDTDGDHVADAKRILSSGYGIRFALIGHDLHGLRIGPDGKLYFSCGDRGLSVPLADGTRLNNQFCGAVLRCNLDGSELEVFATGLRNPQELVFDELGELWTGDNNSDGGDKARLVHVTEGMDAGWRQAYQWLTEPNLRGPWNDERLWEPHFDGQAAYIVPPIANICDGPSGLTYNPGTALGGKYTNHFFLCDFRGGASYSGIQTFTVKPKGSSFELGEFEHFLWGVLATDCDFGPDGALWLSDWVAGWNKTGKGRIYRLESKTPAPNGGPFDTQKLLQSDWSKFEDAFVRGSLVSDDMRVRLAAQFELVARGKKQMLLRLAQDATATKLARLHAIWGLGQLGVRDVERVAEDSDPDLRAAALRVMGDFHRRGQWSASQVSNVAPLIAGLEDPSAKVQRVAAEALAVSLSPLDAEMSGLHERIYSMLARIGESDPALRCALIRVLQRAGAEGHLTSNDGPDVSYSLLDAKKHSSADVRVAAAVALRRLHDPRVAEFLSDRDPRVAVEAARAIYDEQLTDAMPALARLLWREDIKGTSLVRRALNANFRIGTEECARALASFATRESADELHRWEAVDLLTKWSEPPGRDSFTGEWWPLAKRDAPFLADIVESMRAAGIERAPKRVVAAWIDLAERCDAKRVGPALVERAKNVDTDAAIRAAALRAAKKLAPAALEPALDSLVSDKESAVRAAALRAIQGLSAERAYPLLEQAAVHGSPDERRVAFSALAPLADARIDVLLTGELAKQRAGLLPPEVALDLALAAEQRADARVKQALEELRANRSVDPTLAPFVDSLYGGDKGRGRKIVREKAATECLRCHRIEWGEGGQVGPDLVGVGLRLTRPDLLASICDPNRTIAKGFEATVLFLESGKNVAGVIVSENPETIVVRTAQDELIEVDAAEVESRRPDLSAMPQDVSKNLSREEMRDLIEYLANL